MATFVSTTLTKRTGATTSVFAPREEGRLAVSGSVAGFERDCYLQSNMGSSGRRTKVRFTIPRLDADGLIVLDRAWLSVDLWVPNGTQVDSVNDLVGYANSFTASALSNANDILVNGIGIY